MHGGYVSLQIVFSISNIPTLGTAEELFTQWILPELAQPDSAEVHESRLASGSLRYWVRAMALFLSYEVLKVGYIVGLWCWSQGGMGTGKAGWAEEGGGPP